MTAPTTPYTLLTRDLGLAEALITQLAALGGVYLLAGAAHPRRSPRATRASLDALHAALPLAERVYMRLHVRPKRYARDGYCVLEEDGGVLAVYKPPEMPVCAGVDNKIECLAGLVKALVTTRIDVGTSGVVLMAREQSMVKVVNQGLREGLKYYVVFAEFRGTQAGEEEEVVVEGRTWLDYYRAKPELGRGHRPAVLRRSGEGGSAGWVEAVLQVVHRRRMGFCDGRGRVFVVRLCTGRTHQIRVQMAARGYWVLGDGKYERVVGRAYDAGALGGDAPRLGLHCWLVFCARWWRAALRRRDDLCQLVPRKEREAFSEWLAGVEKRLTGSR